MADLQSGGSGKSISPPTAIIPAGEDRGAQLSPDVYLQSRLWNLRGRPSAGELRGHAENPARRRRYRSAPIPGEGATERRLRCHVLRQRTLSLSAAARGAVRASLD